MLASAEDMCMRKGQPAVVGFPRAPAGRQQVGGAGVPPLQQGLQLPVRCWAYGWTAQRWSHHPGRGLAAVC
jgi:hypothetical protein